MVLIVAMIVMLTYLTQPRWVSIIRIIKERGRLDIQHAAIGTIRGSRWMVGNRRGFLPFDLVLCL